MTVARFLPAAFVVGAVLAPVGCDGALASRVDIVLRTHGSGPVERLAVRWQTVALERCDDDGAAVGGAVRTGWGDAWRRAVAVASVPHAHAHGAATDRELAVEVTEDVLAQRRPRRLGTLFPPPGRYCALRLVAAGSDDGAPSVEATLTDDTGAALAARTTATRAITVPLDDALVIEDVESRAAIVVDRDLTAWTEAALADAGDGVDAPSEDALARSLLVRMAAATTLELTVE